MMAFIDDEHVQTTSLQAVLVWELGYVQMKPIVGHVQHICVVDIWPTLEREKETKGYLQETKLCVRHFCFEAKLTKSSP